MDIKILIATHKRYEMPKGKCYLPIHVGGNGKENIGYIKDDTGDNISKKNPYYCELTGLYWAWKNLKCDYLGLAHYRRHFCKKRYISRLFYEKFDCVLSNKETEKLLEKYDIILPKKRKYYIETIYSHYSHTHYGEHLDETRDIISRYCSEYIKEFDVVMKRTNAHMFNMFIMKKELADEYCEWLFLILGELEKRVNIENYDSYQARLYGRVSELLLDVWLEHKKLIYKEIQYMHMERINWLDKGIKFLNAKFTLKKFEKSF